MASLGRTLIVVGLLLAVVGGALLAGKSLGFGRLPGDLRFHRGHITVWVPIVSSIVASVALTVIANLALRLFTRR
jgi:hypothetical protein